MASPALRSKDIRLARGGWLFGLFSRHLLSDAGSSGSFDQDHLAFAAAGAAKRIYAAAFHPLHMPGRRDGFRMWRNVKLFQQSRNTCSAAVVGIDAAAADFARSKAIPVWYIILSSCLTISSSSLIRSKYLLFFSSHALTMAAVDAADALVGDSNLVRVTPQVFDYLLRSAERLFGEHHPAHAIQLFQQRLHVFVRFNL